MLRFPGKFDCTRIKLRWPQLQSWPAHIIPLLACLCTLCYVASAQPQPLQYPEIAWLGRSTYCNPYFGFRLNLPTDLKPEPIHLPVQSHGHNMLLALRLERLERSAELFISAYQDNSENSARFASKVRIQQARHAGYITTGPNALSVHEHQLYRLHIIGDMEGPGSESSYYLALRGYVVHVAIFSHSDDLAASIGSVIEHLEFVASGDSACASSMPATAPSTANNAGVAAMARPSPDPPRLYYGPALPTDLVESTLRKSPGSNVPSGEFSHRTFVDTLLGVRVVLPPGWQSQPIDEADRVTELMRDPMNDPEVTDRRRALFRACSRVLFAAADPATEPIPDIHPALVIAAMPQGCVPDLVPPATPDDRDADAEFATVLLRSLGTPLLGRATLYRRAQGSFTFNLDGTLPYKLPSEKLSRRLGMRVSATASGPWLILVYSVTPAPAVQRELDAHIAIGVPEVRSAK